MTTFEKLCARLQAEPVTTHADDVRAAQCIQAAPGWSGLAHYQFFKACMEVLQPKRVLITGVYFGRDICMMLSAAEDYCREIPEIVGVDLFSPAPCADWPEDKRGLTWEQAGFGPSPSLETAGNSIRGFHGHEYVVLSKNDSISWMCGWGDNALEPFDLIYLDTSHDYATLMAEIAQARRILAPGGILAGDDYIDRPEWGVIRAVGEAFTTAAVYRGVIWATGPEHIV